MFAKNWQKAECLVVDRDVSSVTDGSVNYAYIVEVYPDAEDPFRAIARLPFIATDFWSPNIGQTVGVEFNTKTHVVRFDRHDPRLSAKAYEQARRSRAESTLHADPGTRLATEADRRELRMALLAV
jgi:hypothetical protein